VTRIAEGRAEPVQDRRPQQETADVVGLTLQDLFNQVIDDVAVISREAGNETSDVDPTPHREMTRSTPSRSTSEPSATSFSGTVDTFPQTRSAV